MVRMFHGFILSNSPEFIEFPFGGNAQLQKNAVEQSVPLLPGGTQWPMFASIYFGFKDKPFRLLPDSKKIDRKMTPLNLEGNYRMILNDELVNIIGVQRFLPSMMYIAHYLKIPMFPTAQTDEILIYIPSPL